MMSFMKYPYTITSPSFKQTVASLADNSRYALFNKAHAKRAAPPFITDVPIE